MVRKLILQGVRIFQDEGPVENHARTLRPESSSLQGPEVASYCNKSTRRLLRMAEYDLNIPRSSLRRILTHELHMFQCKLQIVQQWEDPDYRQND